MTPGNPELAAALTDVEPAPARRSASILLVDGATVPWRVLMMRRPRGADFAPNAYVFPGGSVSPDDEMQVDPTRGAALRELWEEVGLLLAYRTGARGRVLARTDEANRVRALAGRGVGFWPALAQLGLQPAFDRLVLCTRWITPLRIRRRYDTHFFVARAPRGQAIAPQAGEVDDWRWVTAREAIDDDRLGLVYATRRILELVGAEPDATALLRRLRRRRERAPVMPTITEVDGGVAIGDGAAPLFRARR
ncbi:MAG: NUDIX hydrolase [Candidatus Dormiibacterota bacterium]